MREQEAVSSFTMSHDYVNQYNYRKDLSWEWNSSVEEGSRNNICINVHKSITLTLLFDWLFIVFNYVFINSFKVYPFKPPNFFRAEDKLSKTETKERRFWIQTPVEQKGVQ